MKEEGLYLVLPPQLFSLYVKEFMPNIDKKVFKNGIIYSGSTKIVRAKKIK